MHYQQELGVADHNKKTSHDNFTIERITTEGDMTNEEDNRDSKLSDEAGHEVKVACEYVKQLCSHHFP